MFFGAALTPTCPSWLSPLCAVFLLLCLACLLEHDVCRVHPCSWGKPTFLGLNLYTVFHPLLGWQIPGFFPEPGCYEASVNMGCRGPHGLDFSSLSEKQCSIFNFAKSTHCVVLSQFTCPAAVDNIIPFSPSSAWFLGARSCHLSGVGVCVFLMVNVPSAVSTQSTVNAKNHECAEYGECQIPWVHPNAVNALSTVSAQSPVDAEYRECADTVDALNTVKALFTFLKTPWPFAFFRWVSLPVRL